jgi:ABC-type transport system involved in cytochrome c biogenesis permease subunit
MDMNVTLSDLVQLGVVLARVALWTAILVAILFGLFTFPIIMVSGFVLMYMLFSYVRHIRD